VVFPEYHLNTNSKVWSQTCRRHAKTHFSIWQWDIFNQ